MQQFFWTPPGSVTETALAPPTYIPAVGRVGFDALDVTLYETRSPYQDGATPLGSSFEPRELVFPFTLVSDSLANMAVLRRATTRLFAPGRGIGVLRWVQDDGTSWIIRCEPSETVRYEQGRPEDGFKIPASIVLQAKDPFWYDASPTTLSAQMYAGGWDLGEAPGAWSFPIALGTRTGQITCTNAGDLAVPVTLTMTGPALGPAFENFTTGAVWRSRQPLLAGEQLIVSSPWSAAPAVKFTPATGTTINVMATVRPGSEWLTLEPGVNVIGFTGSESAGSATLSVSWYNRYLGA